MCGAHHSYPCFFLNGLYVVAAVAWLRGATAASLCLQGSFDSQVQYLLSNLLLTRSEMTNISTVFSDLERTLQQRWPGSEVVPIGSFMTGLMMETSDTDCMINVPHFTVYNETVNRYLIVQAAQLLKEQPHLYADVRSKFRKENEVSLLKFTYIPTVKNCEANFISTKGWRIGKMIGDFYSLDDRIWKTAAVLKFWSNVHRMKHSGILDTYALNLLIIFYLQQEKILPPFYLLENVLLKRDLAKDLEKNIYTAHQATGVYQMLGGFFEYYSKFNFNDYVVSPTLGRAINKKEFEDVSSLPEELSPYKEHLSKPNTKPIALNKKMCIQDVFSQHLNVVENVLTGHIVTFISHVKFATARFQRLPSDRFLSAILVRDKYNHKYFELSDAKEVQSFEKCSSNETIHLLL